MKLNTALAILMTAATAETMIRAAQSTASQWDGVYTLEQAKRGESLYIEKCAKCHAPNLTGGDMTPPLLGSEFTTTWNDLSLEDLFERIRTSMPQDSPGSLSAQQTVDILAFILHKGNYPTGQTELPTDPQMLQRCKFLAMKPDPA